MALIDEMYNPLPYPLLAQDMCPKCSAPFRSDTDCLCQFDQLDDCLVVTLATPYPDGKDFIGNRAKWLKDGKDGGPPQLSPTWRHRETLAGLLYRYLDANWDVISSEWSPWVCAPVPSHPNRISQRQIDPIRYIVDCYPSAREHFGIKCILEKTRDEKSGPEDRGPDPSLWAVRAGNNVEGRRILVIDDRLTTGSTLEGIAIMLKGQGAEAVYGLVLARSLWEDDLFERRVVGALQDRTFDYSDCKLRQCS